MHETIAPAVMGQDAFAIERHMRRLLTNYGREKTTGAEMRAASAFDVALWDILGQATGQPVYNLLGGRCRNRIRVYNDCAGTRSVRSRPTESAGDWGVSADAGGYDDLDTFMHDADTLAESLLAEGFRGMRISPFDHAAVASGGTDISTGDLKRLLEPFEKIRKRVGDRIDIHVEFHGLWNLPAALRIADALAPYRPYWAAEPVTTMNLDALRQYREKAVTWVAAGETLATRWAFRELFEKRAVDMCLLDIGRCGGLSEAKKIATMAEAYELPVAQQNCIGPIQLAASVHLATASPNGLAQEVARAAYHGWFQELAEGIPNLAEGFIAPNDMPGLGVALRPDLRNRVDAHLGVST